MHGARWSLRALIKPFVLLLQLITPESKKENMKFRKRGEMLFENTFGTTAAEAKGREGYLIIQFLLEAEDGANSIYHPLSCRFIFQLYHILIGLVGEL